MTTLNCQSTKESLMAYLASATNVAQVGQSCVATLPIPTVDGRLVDVFVENTIGDYFVVHDGGKAVNELILQDLRITDSIAEHFESLAKRFGISFTDETFKGTVRAAEIQSTILAVGMCSGLAMGQLVGHVPMPLEEPVRDQFGHTLRAWAKKRFKVAGDVTIKGQYAKHRFDFVAYPKQQHAPTMAMSVLLPGSNSLAAAERFGFKTTDLRSSRKYRDWKKVAIQGRAGLWSHEARNLLERCADVVIELPDDAKLDREVVKEKLDLATAA